MSALQILREKAGVLVAGVIGLSLFIFVISDFFGNGRGQRLQAKKYYELGVIGGKSVTYQDYEARIQNLIEIYKLSGNTNMTEELTTTIRDQLWEQIIRENILNDVYGKLGLGVSPDELDALVLGDNPHDIVRQLFTDTQTGEFNKSYLVNFLKSTETDATAKTYWLFFENEIVSDRINTKYNNLITNGLYVTSKQAEYENALSQRTVDFSYIVKNYSLISDSAVKISDTEIKDYYKKHQENYKKSALRDIEYVSFDVTPSAEDKAQAEQWISRTKPEFESATSPVEFINLTADTRHIGFYYSLSELPESLKEFARKEDLKAVYGPYLEDDSYKLAKILSIADRPDSVHVRHILLSTDAAHTTIESVRLYADSLYKMIKDGAPFELLAMTTSVDQGSAQAGGDVGWFKEGTMVVPFSEASFSGKKGDIVIVESTYGVHIIDILDQSKKVRKYDVGIIDRKIIPSSATNQVVYAEASQFAGTNTTYDKFNKAIAEQGLNKVVANDVTPNQKTLPGLETPRYLIMSLFQAKSGSIILDNNQQAVFELGDKYIVAYCTKVLEEGVAPIEDVRSDIVFNLTKDKKAEVIANEFKARMSEGKTLEGISNELGFTVQEATQVNFQSYSLPGAGVEPNLIAAASTAKTGIVEGPVKGNNGVFLLTVNNETTGAGEDIATVKQRLSMTIDLRGSYESFEALRKAANIVDMRYKFY
jgi:peptidyl-prolyl cis-trans isomerase D